MPAKIILVRHGETPFNTEKKLMGWQSDVGLSERGIKDAKSLAAKLAAYPIDAMYHSDLRRTRETAGIISDSLKITSTPEFLLRERNLACFAGKSMHDLQNENPQWVAKFFEHTDREWKMPGGESLGEVHTRFRTLVTKLHDAHEGQTVLLVTHSGYLHVVLRDVFGFFPVETFVEVEHDSVTILEKASGSYRLAQYNRTD